MGSLKEKVQKGKNKVQYRISGNIYIGTVNKSPLRRPKQKTKKMDENLETTMNAANIKEDNIGKKLVNQGAHFVQFNRACEDVH